MRGRLWAYVGAAKKLAVAYHFSRAGGWAKKQYQCGECKRVGYHRERNCRKYFPGAVSDQKRPWVPIYRVDELQYEVPAISINECPVSFITAESLALVEMETQARTIQQATGAAFGGPDSAEWPAWWADVVTVAARCRAAEEYERDKALEYRRRNAH